MLLIRPIISRSLAVGLLLAGAAPLSAQQRKAPSALDARSRIHRPFHEPPATAPMAELRGRNPDSPAWDRLIAEHGPQIVHLDPLTRRPAGVKGRIPFVPGKGNDLGLSDLASLNGGSAPESVTLELLDKVARRFVSDHPALFRIPPGVDFNLNPVASTRVTDAMWNLRYDAEYRGIPVYGAALVFVVKHGNLILWGVNGLEDAAIPATPRLGPEHALGAVDSHIDGFVTVDELGKVSRMIVPEREGARGRHGWRDVYEVTFTRPGEGEYRARVDAQTGEVLEFRDIAEYAQVKGGVYAVGPEAPEVSRPFGYANYGSGLYADAGGSFVYAGGTVTSTLVGRYVRISDACGAISLSASAAPGDLNFGTSAATNCSFGAGNSTRSARSCYYHVDLIKQKGRSFYTSNAWLQGVMQANVNVNAVCNANFSPSTGQINFYRQGTSGAYTCGNTGEIAGIFLHEWGHAMDYNDGNGAQGSGEAMGDTFAMLQTRSSCMGNGFWITAPLGCGNASTIGQNCDGYGNCCTNCSGVRDNDYQRHANATALTPQNIGTANPGCSGAGAGSEPCGYEVHCEGQMPAQANWDLGAKDLPARADLGVEDAWQVMDKLWWQSGPTRTRGYSCTDRNGAPWNNGCAATDWYTAFLAADDDDGNLANGTPHASTIFLAYNRHGISCGVAGDAANQDSTSCPAIGDAGTLSATGTGNNTATLAWTKSATNAGSYRILRNNLGCGFGFTEIAQAVAPTTGYIDSTATSSNTWYYQVQPIGVNPDCWGPVSNCVSVTPPLIPEARYKPGTAVMTGNPAGGDGDIYNDNCETTAVQFTVENAGNVALTNVRVTALTSSNGAVAVTTPLPINLGNLALGATVNGTFNFTTGAGATKAACGAALPFTITVSATEMTAAKTGSFSFIAEQDDTLGNLTYSYETNMDGWVSGGGSWTRTTTYGGSAGTNALTSSSGSISACDVVQSPSFVLSATSALSVGVRWDIEANSQGKSWDRANWGLVRTSDNARALITPSGGRTYTSQSNDPGGLCVVGGQAGYNGANDTTWGDSTFTSAALLAAYPAGTRVKLDMTHATDTSVTGTGMRFDNVRLTNILLTGCDALSNTCGACTAPTGMANNTATDVSACGATGVTISWTAPSAWGDTGGTRSYTVYRDGAPIASGPCSGALPATTTSCVDTPGDALSHTYTVRATNGCGSFFTTAGAAAADANNLPSAPTGVSATTANCANITTTWTNGAGSTSTNLLRYTGACPSVAGLTTFTGVTSPYADATAAAGSSYCIVARAVNACGTADAAGVTGTRAAAPGTAAAPTATATCAGINLSWGAVSGATSYNVMRSTGTCGSATQIASGLTATTYSDTSAVAGTAYIYSIQAVSPCGTTTGTCSASATRPAAPAPTITGGPSGCGPLSLSTQAFTTYQWNLGGSPIGGATAQSWGAVTSGNYTVTVTNAAGCAATSPAVAITINPPPSAPTAVGATTGNCADITVNWTNGTGSTSTNLVRTTGACPSAAGSTTFTGVASSYADTTAASGSSYCYVARAVNACGTADAAGVTGTRAASAGTPGAPTATATCAGVDLSWGAASGATSYNIFRSTGNCASSVQIATGVTATTYSDTSAAAGTAYIYSIQAVSGCGAGTRGACSGSVTRPAAPAPTVTGGPTGCSPVALSTQAFTTYQWNLGGAPIGGATAQNYGATASGNYSVTVTNAAGCSATSPASAITVNTIPATPVQTAPSAGNGQVTVNWNAASGASTYQVKRGALGGPYSNTGGAQAGTSYLDGGLTNGTQYCYVVTATNACGTTGNSNEQCATPSACTPNVRLNDGFEAGTTNWAIAGTWATSTTVAGGGTTSLRGNDPGNNPNRNTCRTAATAGAIAIPVGSTGAQLRFWSQSALAADDYGVVEISTDGGASWSKLTNVNYPGAVATAPTTTCAGALAAGQAVFSGTRAAALYSADLSAYIGQSVLIRFNFVTGATAGAASYWYIDDVRITDGNGVAGTMTTLTQSKNTNDLVQAWPATAGGENYRVYRNTTPNTATWTSPAAVPAASATGWTDAGQLANATSQFYSVTLYNGCAETAK